MLRELPISVVKQALEPQAFRALTALLQHLVGGTDNLSTVARGVVEGGNLRPLGNCGFLKRLAMYDFEKPGL